jgi:hypothetical protein
VDISRLQNGNVLLQWLSHRSSNGLKRKFFPPPLHLSFVLDDGDFVEDFRKWRVFLPENAFLSFHRENQIRQEKKKRSSIIFKKE